MRSIEFWPDYGQGPLWSPDGETVDPASLGLPDDLVQQLSLWNGSYDDESPIEGAVVAPQNTGLPPVTPNTVPLT